MLGPHDRDTFSQIDICRLARRRPRVIAAWLDAEEAAIAYI